MKDDTEAENTIYYISRGLVILAILQYKNKSLNDNTYIHSIIQ